MSRGLGLIGASRRRWHERLRARRRESHPAGAGHSRNRPGSGWRACAASGARRPRCGTSARPPGPAFRAQRPEPGARRSHPARSAPRPAPGARRPRSAPPGPAFRAQRPALRVRRPVSGAPGSGVPRAAPRAPRPASGVRRPASGVRRPASGVRRPASGSMSPRAPQPGTRPHPSGFHPGGHKMPSNCRTSSSTTSSRVASTQPALQSCSRPLTLPMKPVAARR